MAIDPAVERAYQAILQHLLEAGRAPEPAELAVNQPLNPQLRAGIGSAYF